ncbi:Uncharacterised protein [uncultured archaeon]|nr:Uncharacterised protein [uncultured archaeon]
MFCMQATPNVQGRFSFSWVAKHVASKRMCGLVYGINGTKPTA